nr:hypothetical protein [uncultured Oscillibacter sp.]
MRGLRLNRKQKIVRNLLICALLGFCVHAALGFPPYTVKGMCRQVARDYFLEDLEPVYVLQEKFQYSGDYLSRKNTFVLARSGGTYAAFQFQRHGLQNMRYYVWDSGVEMANDVLCVAWGGTLYVAGPFEDAVSATAVVTARRQYATLGEDGEAVDFTLEGKKLSDGAFAFSYISPDHRWSRFEHGQDPLPGQEIDLLDAINLWYWKPLETGNGHTLVHADLPCAVTLYGGDGGVLDVLELKVEVYELNDTW